MRSTTKQQKAINPQDLADQLQRQAQAEKLTQELTKTLFNRRGLDRLRAIPDSEWQTAVSEDADNPG